MQNRIPEDPNLAKYLLKILPLEDSGKAVRSMISRGNDMMPIITK